MSRLIYAIFHRVPGHVMLPVNDINEHIVKSFEKTKSDRQLHDWFSHVSRGYRKRPVA